MPRLGSREDYRNMTMEDFDGRRSTCRWARAEEVAERIIARRGSRRRQPGAVSLNRGAMPHEMFMHQIRRFAREVLPALQAHEVVRVPLGEDVAA